MSTRIFALIILTKDVHVRSGNNDPSTLPIRGAHWTHRRLLLSRGGNHRRLRWRPTFSFASAVGLPTDLPAWCMGCAELGCWSGTGCVEPGVSMWSFNLSRWGKSWRKNQLLVIVVICLHWVTYKLNHAAGTVLTHQVWRIAADRLHAGLIVARNSFVVNLWNWQRAQRSLEVNLECPRFFCQGYGTFVWIISFLGAFCSSRTKVSPFKD